MSNRQSQGGDLKEIAPQEDLMRILECPICISLPLPPIFNCARGHIICGKCRPKMSQCGLCEAEYTDSRNFVMEAMVNASRMSCEYRGVGCSMILRGIEFQDHVSSKCEFRPIACVFGDCDTCNKSIVPFQDYLKHLVAVHGIIRAPEARGNAIFNKKYILGDAALTESTTWPGMYAVFEGKAFVTRTFLDKGMFHFSICIVGSEMDAARYKVRMTFRRPGGVTELDPVLEITMPVLPIRKIDEEIKECMHYMIPKEMFLRACGAAENPQRKEAITWQAKYKILPIIRSVCCTV